MKNTKTIVAVVIVMILALVGLKLTRDYYKKEIEKVEYRERVAIIKNDSLTKLAEGLYTKVVADTATIKQLRKVVDSLKLEIKDPEVIIKTVFVPKEVEKPIDGIVVKDSIIQTKDNYPNSVNPFVKYESTIDVKKGTGVGKFSFNPIEMNLVIGENEDGTHSLTTKLPEYFQVSSVEVLSKPMEVKEEDNFGWLVGVGGGKDFYNNTPYLGGSLGIRYKKYYLDVVVGSNNSVTGLIKIEL